MPFLKFDLSGSMDSAFGFQRSELAAMSSLACDARDEMVSQLPQFNDQGRLLSPRESLTEHSDLRFVSLPEELLAAYTTDREDSPIGQVFRVANGLHDEVDAVVVVGTPAALQTSKAIMQACCIVHHNESSRAARGSKPRMYFVDNVMDNDVTSGILERLCLHGGRETKAECRFAVVVIRDIQPNPSISVARELFVQALERTLDDEAVTLRNRLLIELGPPPIDQQSSLDQLHDEDSLAENEFICTPPDVPPSRGMLSPATLLPAAFLGLDCMRMLSGAMHMTNDFKQSDFDSNLALQLASANVLLASRSGHSSPRVTSVWSETVRTFADWYGRMASMSGVTQTTRTLVEPVDEAFSGTPLPSENAAATFLDIWVDSVRADKIATAATTPLPGIAEKSLLDMMLHSRESKLASRHQAGFATTKLVLPEMDTYSLGQLAQLLMIATELESRLTHQATT